MNQSVVVSKKERRLSVKIIAHKIRAHFPDWVYALFLRLRFFFFMERCSQAEDLTAIYSDGSWIERKTTSDLRLIQNYLSSKKDISILQIGTGNMSLYKALCKTSSIFFGITIVKAEAEFGRKTLSEYSDIRSKVVILNKYSADFSFLEEKKVSVIIDNDIASYACCKYHFDNMLRVYSGLITENGIILVGLKGLGYFDNGFGLTPRMLASLVKPYGLSVELTDYCFILKRDDAAMS
jgi:hypothetical protein